MSWVAVNGLRKTFAGGVVALDDVSFALRRGELFCVVGPTNAGKSTLLKTIAGLHRPDAGTIEIAGRDVTRLEPRQRRVSLLFQNVALFPASPATTTSPFRCEPPASPRSESRPASRKWQGC